MQVVYISSSTIPSRTANSIHVMKMCEAFTELDHKITLYAPQRLHSPLLLADVDISEHYGVKQAFPIQWFRTSSSLREYDYSIRAAFHARKTHPDLVFSRNLAAATLTALWGIPTIFEIHEPPHDLLSRIGHKLLVQGRGLRRLVVITYSLAAYMRSFFKALLSDNKLLVLPDGVDLKRFKQLPDVTTSQKALELPAGSLTLGYAGHLYPGRGIELIFELAKCFPQHRFLLAGGNEEDIIKYSQQASATELTNIIFLGFIPNSRLPQYLAACDLLLMPYQYRIATSQGGDTAKWTSPMKMFEYMATGRLIISSDLPVLREILNDENSVLCPPDNVEAWCQAIQKASDDQNWRMQIGQQARCDVRQYTWKQRVNSAVAGIKNSI